MTRKEEIKQKALSKYPQGTNRYNKFIEGANWADKTMIEKVCNFIIAFNERAKLGIIEPLINVEIFRKVME